MYNSMKYLPMNWCKISSTVWLDFFLYCEELTFCPEFSSPFSSPKVSRHGLFFLAQRHSAEFGTSNAKQTKNCPQIMYRKNGIVSGDVLLCTMVKHHQTTQASYATPSRWGSETGSRNFGRSSMGVACNHTMEVRNITKFFMTIFASYYSPENKHFASER